MKPLQIPEQVMIELQDLSQYYDDDSCEGFDDFITGAAKLADGLPLAEYERQAVVDELLNWETKDYWQSRKNQRDLRIALAELGGLEEFEPRAVYSRKPRIWEHAGKIWIVW